jgi:hypothetical protein
MGIVDYTRSGNAQHSKGEPRWHHPDLSDISLQLDGTPRRRLLCQRTGADDIGAVKLVPHEGEQLVALGIMVRLVDYMAIRESGTIGPNKKSSTKLHRMVAARLTRHRYQLKNGSGRQTRRERGLDLMST